MASPLVGAWEFDMEGRKGLVLFSEGHYSMIGSDPRRTPYQNDPPSDSELAEAFRGLSAMAGSYEVKDNSVTFHRIAARDQGTVGTEAVMDYSIDGDSLTLSYSSGPTGVTNLARSAFVIHSKKVS